MQRADATKNNMGLTAFEGAKVRKKDVDIAKDYLNEDEMQELNRVITMYLESRAGSLFYYQTAIMGSPQKLFSGLSFSLLVIIPDI